jgi:hypothetical protein
MFTSTFLRKRGKVRGWVNTRVMKHVKFAGRVLTRIATFFAFGGDTGKRR